METLEHLQRPGFAAKTSIASCPHLIEQGDKEAEPNMMRISDPHSNISDALQCLNGYKNRPQPLASRDEEDTRSNHSIM